MKRLSFNIILLVLCINALSQSNDWQWAKSAIQPDNPYASAGAQSISIDNHGNIYVTGSFWSDSIKFGTFTLYNTDPTEVTSDIFIVKYDSSGNVLWAKSAIGSSTENPFSIKLDKIGNVYVVGDFFSDSLSFGPYTLYNYGPTDTTDDIFVVKYNPNGNVIWAKSFGGDYYDGASGVATDTSGNLYIGGFYRSDSVSFGPYEVYDANGAGYANAYVIKCDSQGNVLWVEYSISLGAVDINAISTDPSGNIFITGFYDGTTAEFGSHNIQNQSLGLGNIFLVKYNSVGDALWANTAGGDLNDIAYGVTTDTHGSAYITGYYTSRTAYFGLQSLNNDTSNGSSDIFIAKYDSNGNVIWANSIGGDKNDGGQAIAIDTASNISVTGFFFSSQLTFGNVIIRNYDNTGITDDVFIAQYDQYGNTKIATVVGGDYYDVGNGIAVDLDENIYPVGFFRSDEIIFGGTTLTNNTNNHANNPFIAKYTCVVPNTPTISVSGDTLISSATVNNQWYLNDSAIANASGQVYIAMTPGVYTVEVTNGPLCRATSASITTGINYYNSQLPTISLYPNPANNIIMAQSESFLSSTDVKILIQDVIGNVVFVNQSPPTDGKIRFDISGLVDGMYLIKFTVDDRETRTKFIKAYTQK